MSVTYVRTYSLEYENSPTVEQRRSLNTLLMEVGIPTIDRWDDEILEEKYGLVDKTDTSETFSVGWNIDGDHVDKVLSFDYQSTADKIVEELDAVCIDAKITHSKVVDTTTVEQGMRGEELILLDKLENYNLVGYGRKALSYDNEVELTAQVVFGYRTTKLIFNAEWKTDKVARKAAIESHVVDTPLGDMALMQHKFESCFTTVTEYDVTEAEIHCHFDAKTESRSECTPDIINRVKEAKKLLEVEQ